MQEISEAYQKVMEYKANNTKTNSTDANNSSKKK